MPTVPCTVVSLHPLRNRKFSRALSHKALKPLTRARRIKLDRSDAKAWVSMRFLLCKDSQHVQEGGFQILLAASYGSIYFSYAKGDVRGPAGAGPTLLLGPTESPTSYIPTCPCMCINQCKYLCNPYVPPATRIPNFWTGPAGRISSSCAGSLIVLECPIPQHLKTGLFIDTNPKP